MLHNLVLTILSIAVAAALTSVPCLAQSSAENSQGESPFAFDTKEVDKEIELQKQKEQHQASLPPADRNSPMANPVFASLPVEIQDQILNETAEIFRNCDMKKTFSQLTDCECLAGTFFDERIKNPDQQIEIISLDIQNQCPNTPGVAGYAYDQCVIFDSFGIAGKNYDKFCTCYAREMSKLYTATPSASYEWLLYLGNQAITECQNKVMGGVRGLGESGYKN